MQLLMSLPGSKPIALSYPFVFLISNDAKSGRLVAPHDVALYLSTVCDSSSGSCRLSFCVLQAPPIEPAIQHTHPNDPTTSSSTIFRLT